MFPQLSPLPVLIPKWRDCQDDIPLPVSIPIPPPFLPHPYTHKHTSENLRYHTKEMRGKRREQKNISPEVSETQGSEGRFVLKLHRCVVFVEPVVCICVSKQNSRILYAFHVISCNNNFFFGRMSILC